MTGLMVGFPPRSSCSRVPSVRRRLIEAHTPITGPPNMPLGTSSAMESTLLSAKSSCPVHWNPCRAPSTSAKNGSLRNPVNSRTRPARTGRAVPSKLTGDALGEDLADGPGLAGLGSGGVPGGPGLSAVLVLGEYERERDVGVGVAVGVDVDQVDRARVELRAGHRRGYRGRGAGRVRVGDQNRRVGVVRRVKANTSVRSRQRSSPGNLRLSLKWLDMMTPEGVSCG